MQSNLRELLTPPPIGKYNRKGEIIVIHVYRNVPVCQKLKVESCSYILYRVVFTFLTENVMSTLYYIIFIFLV